MSHNKRLFQMLMSEVGEWSQGNFGMNDSKWPYSTTTTRNEHGVPLTSRISPLICLDHTACVLGIIEELGELTEAVKENNKELIRDSIGDTIIYLADYVYRIGFGADIIDWYEFETTPHLSVFQTRQAMILAGKLAHVNLKRHQGIRDYHTNKFDHELGNILTWLLINLRCTYALSNPKPNDGALSPYPTTSTEAADAIFTIASNVWHNVKARNWKKNAATGGQ